MAGYGIHECLRMDKEVHIKKYSGGWELEIDSWTDTISEDEVEFNVLEIEYCPFCGEKLE